MTDEKGSNHLDSSPTEGQYAALVSLRNTEISVYWTRYNIQSAINCVVLAAALASRSDSYIKVNMPFFSMIGILMTIIWIIFIIMGKMMLFDLWESNLINYEKITTGIKYKLFYQIHGTENTGSLRRIFNKITILALTLPLLCMGAWVYILFHTI